MRRGGSGAGSQFLHDRSNASIGSHAGPFAYLPVQGAAALIAFLEQALGAQLRLRVEDPPGRVRHAELRIADGVVMLEVCRHALALGGRAVHPPRADSR